MLKSDLFLYSFYFISKRLTSNKCPWHKARGMSQSCFSQELLLYEMVCDLTIINKLFSCYELSLSMIMNTYLNYVTDDQNRVVLLERDENGSDYFNASYINVRTRCQQFLIIIWIYIYISLILTWPIYESWCTGVHWDRVESTEIKLYIIVTESNLILVWDSTGF